MLSRKHYKRIAKIINLSFRNSIDIDSSILIDRLVDYFREDNDRFDQERFKMACYEGGQDVSK